MTMVGRVTGLIAAISSATVFHAHGTPLHLLRIGNHELLMRLILVVLNQPSTSPLQAAWKCSLRGTARLSSCRSVAQIHRVGVEQPDDNLSIA
jgi:hypothetical protein